MRIELDAIVNEYVLKTLEAVPAAGKSPRAKKREVTAALKVLVESDLVLHRYNSQRRIDEFRATHRLIMQWKRDFPELNNIVDPHETIVVEIGKNSGSFWVVSPLG